MPKILKKERKKNFTSIFQAPCGPIGWDVQHQHYLAAVKQGMLCTMSLLKSTRFLETVHGIPKTAQSLNGIYQIGTRMHV